jgi:hypothetical protein
MIHRIASLSLLVIVSAILGADPKDAPATKFELKLDSKVDMKIGTESASITGDTSLRYAWQVEGKKRLLTFDNLDVKVLQGSAVLLSAGMSREAFEDRSGPKANVVKAADAPKELREMLQDSFGPVVCTLEVDPDGKETGRKLTDKAGAKALMDQGMVANALIFHPPFSSGKEPWKAKVSVSMGDGGLADGDLTYTPQPGSKGGEVVVKVEGTLKKDKHVAGQKTIKNAVYKVTGSQTYSTEKKEWVSGKLDMDVAFDLEIGELAKGSAKGTMNMTLKSR